MRKLGLQPSCVVYKWSIYKRKLVSSIKTILVYFMLKGVIPLDIA